MKAVLVVCVFIIQFPINAQNIGTFEDIRDGQEYKTVTYKIRLKDPSEKSVTWMAENLNYAIAGSYYRGDSLSNAEIYGRLYTWPLAIKSCPAGWRLPSDEDWINLITLYGGLDSAGKHLKSESKLWVNEGNGTNKSLFSALPYGTGDGKGTYPNFGSNAIFWSATEKDEDYAWDWILFTRWEKILRSDGHKHTTANSVRCVKNKE